MRRAILIVILGAVLAAPAGAAAKTATASAGGVTATLSYRGGPGITTKDEQLTISQAGKPTYAEPVPAKGCFKLCTPEPTDPVSVVQLVKPGSDEDVVLSLFTGGADCCSIDLIYTESAAIPGNWEPITHNFGEDGAKLERIGPNGADQFVSGDPAFYCEFSACYESGLPLQIFALRDGALVNVTKQHPALISQDAARWDHVFTHDPSQGLGAFAAMIADDENVGEATGISTMVTEYGAKLPHGFLTQLKRFLKLHGYNDYI